MHFFVVANTKRRTYIFTFDYLDVGPNSFLILTARFSRIVLALGSALIFGINVFHSVSLNQKSENGVNIIAYMANND